MQNTLWTAYGRDYPKLAYSILEAAKLHEAIAHPAAKIGLKPNLVTPSPASHGATTHPEVAAGVIEYLKDHGFSNIAILEGAWVGASTTQAFEACGYQSLAKRYGVPLINTKADQGVKVDCAGMPLYICRSAQEIDFWINLPVVKGHCQTGITCALKNLKGLIPDSEKRRFHTLGLMKPIAHLNAGIPTGFVLADGICGDLDFEEGGNPVQRDLLMGCYDPVLCDAFAAELMGYAPGDIGYIPIAASLGVGSMYPRSAAVVQLSPPAQGAQTVQPTGKIRKLAAYAQPLDACSACYGNLIYALSRMQERGTLAQLPGPVAIGQGYLQKQAPLGVGRCTRGCDRSLPGCPPTGAEMLAFLEDRPPS